jgi:DNA-binding protein YbaB
MTMWVDDQDQGDLSGPATGPEDEPTTDDDLLAPVGGAEEWTPEQGFPDSSMTVRIWVDADKRLTKVRISNRWRERAKGTTLSNMFDEAFVLATAALGTLFPTAERSPDTEPNESLSWESLDDVVAGIAEVSREQAALDADPASEMPSRWVGAPVEGHSANRMVAVRLSLHGRVEKVAFSDAWLNQSRVSEVCAAVMEAQAAALARFVPPVYEPGDRERLADRFRRLEERSAALLRRGPVAEGGSR